MLDIVSFQRSPPVFRHMGGVISIAIKAVSWLNAHDGKFDKIYLAGRDMDMEKIQLAPCTDNEDAYMYWECLRRRNDYQGFYAEHRHLQECYQLSLKSHGPLPENISAPVLLKKLRHNLDLCNFKWGIPPVNPNKYFNKLDAIEKKAICSIFGGFSKITLQSEQLDSNSWRKLFMLTKRQGHILPCRFTLKIVPRNTDLDSFGKPIPSRKRADYEQFTAEMLAWDMHKANKKMPVYMIGEKLKLAQLHYKKDDFYEHGEPTKQALGIQKRIFESAAREKINAAQKKINNCVDRRCVT